ncbi:MAG TPA: HEAT repeat domain-containing protein [Brevundimonas sp.]|uniref:HEAT repeat domain-containing protein n=1 Tax=Brevundimonas sp. TaxID=1871086 RepID=UPI002EDB520E
MNLLLVLWWSSLAMAAAALLWMSALVAARVRRAGTDARRAHERRLVQAACLEIATGTGDAVASLRPVRGRARLLAESLIEFLAIVRGAERDRLVSAFQAMAIDETFRQRLFRGSKAGRLASAEVLSAFPGAATAAALNRLLQTNQDPEVRVAAVKALIDLDAPPSILTLLEDMRRRGVSDSLLYLPLVRRLAVHEPDAALAALADATLDPSARSLLADAVAAAGDYRAIEPLSLAARDGHHGLRMAAVAGLGVLAHPAAGDTIIAALDDSDWEVRAAACEAAARMNVRQAIPGLVMRLADSVWWVRFQAAEALTRMGPAGIQSLRLAAGADIDIVRRAAALALAEKGLTETIPAGQPA